MAKKEKSGTESKAGPCVVPQIIAQPCNAVALSVEHFFLKGMDLILVLVY